jgi:hypothetical protein
MNSHILADRLTAGIGGVYGDRMKFFREGDSSPHVSELLKEIEMEFTHPAGLSLRRNENRHHAGLGEYKVPVRWENGAMGEQTEGVARYNLLRWAGAHAETLIYHPGSGETDYSARIRRIAKRAGWQEKNLIAVSVPFNGRMKEYLYGVGSLRRFAFMWASSVLLTERLTEYLRSLGNERIVCSGMSLGGWITNLHHTYFDSCSAYKPIFAGAAPDHLFTETVYRRLLASTAAPEAISAALNFEADFAGRDNGNVFPCMSRYDQYIDLERQSGIYRPEKLRVIERGHVTGAAAYRELAEHLS